jgi:hypothetical protein
VYASLWSSPSTTQHSLPGGRYPFPGPDFHRLDRASFAWRTANPLVPKQVPIQFETVDGEHRITVPGRRVLGGSSLSEAQSAMTIFPISIGPGDAVKIRIRSTTRSALRV